MRTFMCLFRTQLERDVKRVDKYPQDRSFLFSFNYADPFCFLPHIFTKELKENLLANNNDHRIHLTIPM